MASLSNVFVSFMHNRRFLFIQIYHKASWFCEAPSFWDLNPTCPEFVQDQNLIDGDKTEAQAIPFRLNLFISGDQAN